MEVNIRASKYVSKDNITRIKGKIQNALDTKADISYVNNLVGDVEDLLETLTTGSGAND